MDAQILGDELMLSLGGREVPVRPIYVYITNTGQVPVLMRDLEFQLHTSSIEGVAVTTTIQMPNENILPVGAIDEDSDAPETVLLGVIDPDSESWVEAKELRQSADLRNTVLAPGQSCVERRHILSPGCETHVLTKVEVTLRTAKASRRWYGFVSEPAMCLPERFSGTATAAVADDAAAPPRAPQ